MYNYALWFSSFCELLVMLGGLIRRCYYVAIAQEHSTIVLFIYDVY